MKDFLKNVLIALLVLVVGLVLIPLGREYVDNRTINQEYNTNEYNMTNTNYNAYFSVVDEDKIISTFGLHAEYGLWEGYYGYKINFGTSGMNIYNNSFYFGFYMPVLVRKQASTSHVAYTMFITKDPTGPMYGLYFGTSGGVTIFNNNNFSNSDIFVYLVGVSNYV